MKALELYFKNEFKKEKKHRFIILASDYYKKNVSLQTFVHEATEIARRWGYFVMCDKKEFDEYR